MSFLEGKENIQRKDEKTWSPARNSQMTVTLHDKGNVPKGKINEERCVFMVTLSHK